MKLTKEDIKTYGTEDEKELLKEYDVFKDEPFEIPVGDPQDPTDDEPRPLEDEQLVRTQGKVSIPESLLEDIFEFISDSEESDQQMQLLDEIGGILGYPPQEDKDERSMKPWEKY